MIIGDYIGGNINEVLLKKIRLLQLAAIFFVILRGYSCIIEAKR